MARLHPLDFDEQFREQYPLVVNELALIVGDRALARGIAQDAFIRQFVAWTRVSHYDKPGAWVRRVAIRIAFKIIRHASRTEPLQDEHIPASTDVDVDRQVDVRRAIAQLPDGQRAAVVLHYYRDLPISEVAKALGCKESTAKVHLHLARKKLAEILVHYR